MCLNVIILMETQKEYFRKENVFILHSSFGEIKIYLDKKSGKT